MLRAPSNDRIVETIDSRLILAKYGRDYNIDITEEFKSIKTISLLENKASGLRYYTPSHAAGGSDFYDKLQKFQWYYMPEKWEHQIALKYIGKGNRALEVGCAFGSFIELMQRKKNVDALGIELSEEACELAKSKNLPVENSNLNWIKNTQPASFDVVCHFEVLEHIPEPEKFLEDAIACLKPSGKLIFAVPNNDSFIRFCKDNPLNMPPHHMALWNPKSIRYLEQIFPISLNSIHYEPLQKYHIEWWAQLHAQKFNLHRKLNWRIRPIIKKILVTFANAGLARFITGHTVLAVFTKK